MICWKILIILFWPTIKAIRHVFGSIKDAWMLRHHEYRRQWFWKRFCDAMASILCLMVIVESIDTSNDQLWKLFIIKTAVVSFIITVAINDVCDTIFKLFCRRTRLLADIHDHLIEAAIAWFLCRPLACVILAFAAFWLVILVLEIVVDELVALKHKSDRPPVISPFDTRYWNLVSVLQSSNNGFFSQQFRRIRVIDFNELDDPFYPHISTIYVLEVCRRNVLWRELTIWKVSLLNGGKKKIHAFNYVGMLTDGEPFSRRWKRGHWINGFQSNGVLMICHPYPYYPLLFVHDVRYGMSKNYILAVPIGEQDIGKTASISCLRRLFNQDGSVSGWRVRIVWSCYTFCDCHVGRCRSFLCKNVYELREKPELISHEEIVFGQCLGYSAWINRSVRTSRGQVGVYREVRNIGDGPVMLYDPFVDQFIFLPNFDALRQFDRPLAMYIYTPSPMGSVQFGDENGDINPPVLTDRECVECTKDVVICTRFKPPSMKLLAATSLFKSMPNLRREMSAEEFRRETGISEMHGHFER